MVFLTAMLMSIFWIIAIVKRMSKTSSSSLRGWIPSLFSSTYMFQLVQRHLKPPDVRWQRIKNLFFYGFNKEGIRSNIVWRFLPLKNQNSSFLRVSSWYNWEKRTTLNSMLLLKQTNQNAIMILHLLGCSWETESLWNRRISVKNESMGNRRPAFSYSL